MRYIALLRGINISGKNKISMPELKTALGEKGFADVKTYLNNENVIFSDDEPDAVNLQKEFVQSSRPLKKVSFPCLTRESICANPYVAKK